MKFVSNDHCLSQFVSNKPLSSIFLLLPALFEDEYRLEKGLGFVWKKVAVVWLTVSSRRSYAQFDGAEFSLTKILYFFLRHGFVEEHMKPETGLIQRAKRRSAWGSKRRLNSLQICQQNKIDMLFRFQGDKEMIIQFNRPLMSIRWTWSVP